MISFISAVIWFETCFDTDTTFRLSFCSLTFELLGISVSMSYHFTVKLCIFLFKVNFKREAYSWALFFLLFLRKKRYCGLSAECASQQALPQYSCIPWPSIMFSVYLGHLCCLDVILCVCAWVSEGVCVCMEGGTEPRLILLSLLSSCFRRELCKPGGGGTLL